MDNALKTFDFRLVSPDAEIMTGTVLEATVPGTEGDIGVRAGHMPLISTLRPGVVTVVSDHEPVPARFFIAGGFANVNNTSCTVLAETAVDVLTLNASDIAADVAALKGRLNTESDVITKATLQGELEIAQARLIAAENK